jgi:ATP-dependent protease ClpP protease subunit
MVLLYLDRDRFLTPSEAIEYGLVDDVLRPARPEAK